MEEKIVVTCEEIAIWAHNKFNKTDGRIKRLSAAVFFISAGGIMIARWMKQTEKKMAEMQKEIEALKQNDIPVSE